MAATVKAPSSHRFSFYRAGGVDQVRLDKGADILALDQLDQKLWVALSCPVKGLEFDSRTLDLLDLDKDAHVRPPEILAAVQWLREVLKDPEDLVKDQDGVALAAIAADTAEGKLLLASAKRILHSLGKGQATSITVADTTQTAEIFIKARLNGDGVVPPQAVEDAAARQVAQEIVDCLGGEKDRSGSVGFDQKRLDAFFADCAAFAGWHQQAEGAAKTILPLGDATDTAYAALDAVRAKIDDFFGRCRLAAFDPRALAALNREEKAYLELAAKDMTITAAEVTHFPLAMVEANKSLPLSQGVNPAWAAALARFRDTCCKDKTALTEAEWAATLAKFEPYRAWLAAKAGTSVEKLGLARVRAILASKFKDALQQAIAEDLAVAGEIDAITKVEKLTRLHRDFHKLLNNYVSFTDFYARRGAIFQAGTLYLDGRSCDLCFNVNDAAKHASMGPMAKTYIAYVDCSRPSGEKMTVACAFTAGNSDNLFTGRNGIFYDRKGRDWNATIAKIVDNPISIGQAFWAPYKKVLRFIEESVAKRAAAADADATTKLQSAAVDAAEAAKTGKPEVAAPKKMDIGVLAAISVAISSVTVIAGTVLEKFFGLGYLMPIGVVGLVLAISGPSMLIAYMKLRVRNLGPILDANGWAVNTLTKVNIPLGSSLTALPRLPDGAMRSLVDPYAPKRSPWPRVFLFLIVLAVIAFGLYRFNLLYTWTGNKLFEHVSASFDGPEQAPAGSDVVVRLGSGATQVRVTGIEGISVLPVTNNSVTVPLKNAKEGDTVGLSDVSTSQPQHHDIKVTAPKK